MIVEKRPRSPLHSALTAGLQEAFLAALKGFWVRLEQPLTFSDSEPEPDISIVAGRPEDYGQGHPRTAKLVIEVAVSSEELDRVNASLYAEAGVEEYWLVPADQKTVEVRTLPVEGHWTRINTYRASENISSVVFPQVTLRLLDLYPAEK